MSLAASVLGKGKTFPGAWQMGGETEKITTGGQHSPLKVVSLLKEEPAVPGERC